MILYKKGGVSGGTGAKTEMGKEAQAKADNTQRAYQDSARAARQAQMMQEGTQGWKPKKKGGFPNGPEKNLNPYRTPNLYETKQDGGSLPRPRLVKEEEKAKIFQAIGTAPGRPDAEIRDQIQRIHREFGPNGIRLAPAQSKRINQI